MQTAVANYLDTAADYVLPTVAFFPAKMGYAHRKPRILVLFLGMGSVEQAIWSQFP